MSWNEAINAGCALAGITKSELARRMGYLNAASIGQLVHARRTPSIVNFARILDALGLSGGYDGRRGWWVARPEDVSLPREAGK